MKDAPAIYLGRIVDKKHFRTFIYSPIGDSKIVESWDEYEKHMATGLWFSTREEAIKPVKQTRKTKLVKTKGVLGEIDDMQEEVIPSDPLAFEVTNEDFLPKIASK